MTIEDDDEIIAWKDEELIAALLAHSDSDGALSDATTDTAIGTTWPDHDAVICCSAPPSPSLSSSDSDQQLQQHMGLQFCSSAGQHVRLQETTTRRHVEHPGDPEAKKETRMARNRASAAASRKRKRDKMEELEQQVAFLVSQNEKLSRQLHIHKQQAATFQKENAMLKQQNQNRLSAPSPQQQLSSEYAHTQPHGIEDQPAYIQKSAALTEPPYDSPQMECILWLVFITVWIAVCAYSNSEANAEVKGMHAVRNSSLKLKQEHAHLLKHDNWQMVAIEAG